MPAAFALLMLFAGSMLVQSAGHVFDTALVHWAFPISLPFALMLTQHYFRPARFEWVTGLCVCLALYFLGIIGQHFPDMSSDGMGYQQPAVQALLGGWNPLHGKAELLWQNIYPSGIWSVEASIAALFGNVETAKLIQPAWFFIALVFAIVGLNAHMGTLSLQQKLLALLLLFSPVVITQMPTHYVDAPIYLAGLTFLGALLMQGAEPRIARAALISMGACVLFIVNAKLSGLYHAVVLCALAVMFLWRKERVFPLHATTALFLAGLTAVLFIGWRPYVTSLLDYHTLLPMGGDSFSAAQRPENLSTLSGPLRFLYSLFSVTGGDMPRENALLKWPWQVTLKEWRVGYPDARSGGFGPLFALAFCLSLAACIAHAMRHGKYDKELLLLAAGLYLGALLFPEGWWLRYVPFAYAVPILLLFTLRAPARFTRWLITAVAIIFSVNSAAAIIATYRQNLNEKSAFVQLEEKLQRLPHGSVYLVPPGADYRIYNATYQTLQRRFGEKGIEVEVRVDAPCPRRIDSIGEFRICY